MVIVGRGASGKSTFSRSRCPTSQGSRSPSWTSCSGSQALIATTPRDQWVAKQYELVAGEGWILDGDLGPYDAPDVRLRAADTIILLDFSLARCAGRAIRRSPLHVRSAFLQSERADFWRWLLAYRRRSRPLIMKAIATHAPSATLLILRNPREVRRFEECLTRESTLALSLHSREH